MELLVLTVTMIGSIGLAIAMAMATLFAVFSFMTRGMVRLNL